MTAGFITGALLGGLLLGVIPNLVLIRTLALLLLISAVKLWRHWPPLTGESLLQPRRGCSRLGRRSGTR